MQGVARKGGWSLPCVNRPGVLVLRAGAQLLHRLPPGSSLQVCVCEVHIAPRQVPGVIVVLGVAAQEQRILPIPAAAAAAAPSTLVPKPPATPGVEIITPVCWLCPLVCFAKPKELISRKVCYFAPEGYFGPEGWTRANASSFWLTMPEFHQGVDAQAVLRSH